MNITQNDITIGDLVKVSDNTPVWVVESIATDTSFRIEGFDSEGEYHTVFIEESDTVNIWE